MNRISAIALFAAATFAAAASASAQQTLTVTKVPFAFTVNGTTLPAGGYTVKFVRSDLAQISSTDHAHPNSILVVTRENIELHPHGTSRLVFKAYGDRYFLHEIVDPAETTDEVVPPSKQEDKARVEWASKNGGQPVLVALK